VEKRIKKIFQVYVVHDDVSME